MPKLEEGVVGFIAIEGEWVEHLYIAPAQQELGIGDTFLQKAKELRPEGLMLWTFEGNHRARRFYEQARLRRGRIHRRLPQRGAHPRRALSMEAGLIR